MDILFGKRDESTEVMTLDSSLFRSKEQEQFARRLEAHLDSGGLPLLLEGAAGLGKTRGYLAPLIATGGPVAVCVPTRALAEQLLTSKDLACILDGRKVEVFTPKRNFSSVGEYREHKLRCRNADLLICTHQAALIDVLAKGELLDLKGRFAIVFDEADQLPDAASLRLNCAIPEAVISNLGLKPNLSHQGVVSAVVKALTGGALDVDEPAILKASCNAIQDALTDPEWYQTVGMSESGDLVLLHRLPARAIKPLLTHNRLAFVSATLSVSGSFKDYQDAVGLQQVSAFSQSIEPRKHGHLDVVVESWDAAAPQHMASVSEHVAGLRGMVLVAVTSHEDAHRLGALMPAASVRSGDGESVGEAVSRMEGNVLIAAGAWAGLDTHVQWSHVVLPKVPYGQPSILDGHVVSRYVDSKNAAVRRFRQGLARGLRKPDAHCTLHLLDARFERKEFVEAIPQRFAMAYKGRFGVVEFRTRQAAFRRLMFERYGGVCPITGCNEPAALEAAHLGDRGGWRTNHTHGILLRRDVHSMLDSGKLEIRNGMVHTQSEHYRDYDGVVIPQLR